MLLSPFFITFFFGNSPKSSAQISVNYIACDSFQIGGRRKALAWHYTHYAKGPYFVQKLIL